MKYLLLLDYDGTLVPIVGRPEHAALSVDRKQVLRTLSRQPGIKMAIISGRKLADIKKQISIPGIIYIGNHGFEIEAGKRVNIHPAAKRFGPVLKAVKSALVRAIKVKGAFIEDKGFTLSLHYRMVKRGNLKAFLRAYREAIKPWRNKVKITEGKKVFEVRPPVKWDKGEAIKWMIKGMGLGKYLPIYIGDDRTDEDAFKALKDNGLTFAVGGAKRSHAKYHFRSIAGVYGFLSNIEDEVRKYSVSC